MGIVVRTILLSASSSRLTVELSISREGNGEQHGSPVADAAALFTSEYTTAGRVVVFEGAEGGDSMAFVLLPPIASNGLAPFLIGDEMTASVG